MLHSLRDSVLAVLRESGFIVLTFACSMILIAFLSFAPATLTGQGTFTTLDGTAYRATVQDYLQGLLHGQLGLTKRGTPISPLLAKALTRSAILLSLSFLFTILCGLAWGAALALVRRGLPRLLLFGTTTLLTSLPTFMILLLLIQLVATITSRTGVRLTYVQGYGVDRHLILPTFVLTLRGATYFARLIHVAHNTILRQDWIQVARAKGLGGWALWRQHVLPALWLAIIGSAISTMRVLISGLIIVEYLYNWGGIGAIMVSIGEAGLRPTDGALAAGAAGILVLVYLLVDSLGRWMTAQALQRGTGLAL